MKKIISIFSAFALLVLCAGACFATVEIASGDNAVIVGSKMGSVGTTAMTEVIKVSTGAGTSAAVGDVMLWDTTFCDGYHVVKATTSDGASGEVAFAGVMVTSTSQDSAYGSTTAKGNSPTVGYMAVRGLVRAKVVGGTQAYGLKVYGATSNGSFTTATKTSSDIGILLKAEGSLSRVWLK
jgi:hypothetical protein